MPAHHRMPVDAIRAVAIGGKEVAEGGIAPELRGTYHKWHNGLAERLPSDLDCPPDAAGLRAGIEGRADLVVAYLPVEFLQPPKCNRKVLIHPTRRLAATCARKPEGSVVGEAREKVVI